MKKLALLVAVLSAVQPMLAQDEFPHLSLNAALPLQAAVCDVIGIGHIASQTSTNAVIKVSDYWIGDSGTNTVVVSLTTPSDFAGCNTNFLFFLSKYQSFLELEPSECHFSYILDMDYHRSRYQPDGLYLFDGIRSWIPVVQDTTTLLNWCSNLVYVSQVNTNLQAFYELIRDGYRLNPATSRIRRDSEYTFQYCSYYMTTNFMHQIWSDTNLVGRARNWVNMEYQQETKTWLP